MISDSEREAMIQELLEHSSLLREEAEEIVAIHLGESVGDIVPVPPLTREERRRIGLGLTMEEARERRRTRALTPEPIEPPVVTSLNPEERAAVAALLIETTSIPPELVDEEIDAYLSGAERIAGRPLLPAGRRRIGRRIEQALKQRRAQSAELAANRESA
jgi:hypothetical protein